MSPYIIGRMGLRALSHNIIRTLLTLLGIIIGVAGIITISAVGKGTQKKARDQYLAYGTKAIDIVRGNWIATSKKPPKPITEEDMSAIRAQCSAVQYICPTVSGHYERTIDYEGHEHQAVIEEANEQLLRINERSILHGMFITKEHVAQRDTVVVLSPEIAEALFKKENPCGKTIRIGKIPFTIIGIIAPRTIKGKWEGLRKDPVYIPYTTHIKFFRSEVGGFTMSTYTEDQVALVTRQLEKMFRANHGLKEGEPNDFMIYNLQAFAQAAQQTAESVGIFALLAALVALIVGGIGVMNIMLVAVKERTKEIGIKTALGATMHMIRMQFLIEAITVCLLGGIIGVIVGIITITILTSWAGILTIIDYPATLFSFSSTAMIGLIFGFYPAERAARLRPVEALTEY